MKVALVFCADKKFETGLTSTIKTLKDNLNYDDYDSFLITDDMVDCKLVTSIIKIDENKYKNIPTPNPRFKKAFYKFEMFNDKLIRNYDRVIFFDSDLLFLGDISYLFSDDLNQHALWIAKDDGIKLAKVRKNKIYTVNTGVVVYNCKQIGTGMTDRLIKFATTHKSFDNSDQGTINDYICQFNLDLEYLPMEYNCLKRIYQHHREIWNKIESNVRILHFVGDKPWGNSDKREPIYKPLNSLWRQQTNA